MIIIENKKDIISEIGNISIDDFEISTKNLEYIAGQLASQVYDFKTNDYRCSNERRRRLDEGYVDVENLEIRWCQANSNTYDGEETIEFNAPKYSDQEISSEIRSYRRILKSRQINQLLAILTKTFVKKVENIENRELGRFVYARFHVIGYFPELNLLSKAIPDMIHQDDVEWTQIILLEKINIEGGVNMFFSVNAAGKNHNELIGTEIVTINMKNFFDSIAWDDRKSSHFVTPMSKKENGRAGSRIILIIDIWESNPTSIH